MRVPNLFSLGVVLYEMLTGVSPFLGANAETTKEAHIPSPGGTDS